MIESYNLVYSDTINYKPFIDKFLEKGAEHVLIQVFTSVFDSIKIQNILTDLKSKFPGVGIIGTTSSNHISHDQVISNCTLLSITYFDTSQVLIKSASGTKYYELGTAICKDVDNDAQKAIILFSTGISEGRLLISKKLLATMKLLNTNATIAGGQSTPQSKENENNYLFTQDGIIERGAVACFLSGKDLRTYNNYSLALEPIGKKFTVTEADNFNVHTIDHIDIMDFYNHYLGIDHTKNDINNLINFPLVTSHNYERRANPVKTINDDNSFEFIHRMQVGEQVQFACFDYEKIRDQAKVIADDMEDKHIQAVFAYSCMIRQEVLNEYVTYELNPIAEKFNLSGYFSPGQFYTNKTGITEYIIDTFTVLGLSEGEAPAIPPENIKPLRKLSDLEQKQLTTLTVLQRILELSSRELDIKNRQLQELANKDALTDLFNRRKFDDDLNALIAACQNHPFSLILFDVDFFKAYNDLYGHVKGDECLRAIGEILNRILSNQQLKAYRYGGEEFAVILPGISENEAYATAEMIRQWVFELNMPHEKSTISEQVTISIGVLTTIPVASTKPVNLVEIVDKQLYKAKLAGRNNVQQISL